MSSTIKRHRQSSSSSSTEIAEPTNPSSGALSGLKSSTGSPGRQHSGHHPAKSFRILSPGESSPPRGGSTGGDNAAEGGGGDDDDDDDGGRLRRHPVLLQCTLPPTCTRRPTPLANTKELESHYATCHAHVCEQNGCGCVFPDARLLELVSTTT